jgi:hypothetical protein
MSLGLACASVRECRLSIPRRETRRLRLGSAVLQLARVFVLVVAAARLDDEAVVSDRPFLKAGDTHGLPAPARSCVRARERPVVLDRLVVEDDVVHVHLYVRERVDERTRDLGDLGGISTVDRDRTARDEVVCDLRGVVATPGVGVAARELPYAATLELGRRRDNARVGQRAEMSPGAFVVERWSA